MINCRGRLFDRRRSVSRRLRIAPASVPVGPEWIVEVAARLPRHGAEFGAHLSLGLPVALSGLWWSPWRRIGGAGRARGADERRLC
jgi:hypothetical protein